jgi:hypothetical protein
MIVQKIMYVHTASNMFDDDGSIGLPLLIQTFLRNFVGILTKNFTPAADSTSWRLFPRPHTTFGIEENHRAFCEGRGGGTDSHRYFN